MESLSKKITKKDGHDKHNLNQTAIILGTAEALSTLSEGYSRYCVIYCVILEILLYCQIYCVRSHDTLYSFVPDMSLYVSKHLKPFINFMNIIQLAFNLLFLFSIILHVRVQNLSLTS